MSVTVSLCRAWRHQHMPRKTSLLHNVNLALYLKQCWSKQRYGTVEAFNKLAHTCMHTQRHAHMHYSFWNKKIQIDDNSFNCN